MQLSASGVFQYLRMAIRDGEAEMQGVDALHYHRFARLRFIYSGLILLFSTHHIDLLFEALGFGAYGNALKTHSHRQEQTYHAHHGGGAVTPKETARHPVADDCDTYPQPHGGETAAEWFKNIF